MSEINEKQEFVSKYKKTIIKNYNQAYDKWQHSPNNGFYLSHTDSDNEITFVSGQGFIHETAADKEKSLLSKTLQAIGTAMLMYFFISVILPEIIVIIAHLCGIQNVNYYFFLLAFKGTSEIVPFFMLFITLVKFLIPLSYLILKFKMPIRAAVPIKVEHKSDILFGVSLTFALLGLLGMINIIYPEVDALVIKTDVVLEPSISNYSISFFIHCFFKTILFAVFSEALIHGVILRILRQYGDVFAVLITFIIAMLCYNPLECPTSYIIASTIAGIVSLRTNSTLPCIIIITVQKFFSIGFDIINFAIDSRSMLIIYSLSFLIVGSIISILTCIFLKQPRRLLMNKTNLSFHSKMECTLTFRIMQWIIITITFDIMLLYLHLCR